MLTFLGTLTSTMKAPGFSTAREMPSSEGPGEKVALVAVALNLRSPAAAERVNKLVPREAFSDTSYFPLMTAFIFSLSSLLASFVKGENWEKRDRSRVLGSGIKKGGWSKRAVATTSALGIMTGCLIRPGNPVTHPDPHQIKLNLSFGNLVGLLACGNRFCAHTCLNCLFYCFCALF